MTHSEMKERIIEKFVTYNSYVRAFKHDIDEFKKIQDTATMSAEDPDIADIAMFFQKIENAKMAAAIYAMVNTLLSRATVAVSQYTTDVDCKEIHYSEEVNFHELAAERYRDLMRLFKEVDWVEIDLINDPNLYSQFSDAVKVLQEVRNAIFDATLAFEAGKLYLEPVRKEATQQHPWVASFFL